MKKLLLTFLFILCSIISFAQYQQQPTAPNPNYINLINITVNPVDNGWAMVGNTCAGCASYYFKVFKSSEMHMGEDGNYYYYYYFYFYSNSYYSNGAPASTYLQTVNFYADGMFIFTAPYIMADRNSDMYDAWVRTRSGSATVLFQPQYVGVQ